LCDVCNERLNRLLGRLSDAAVLDDTDWWWIRPNLYDR
jgi:hypothetical protein